MPRERQRTSLVIGPSSSGLRRTLDPAAWVVLEEMLLRSTAVGVHRVVRVSVRSLAGSLGLAKDTAARAIRRLRAAGLVDGVQQRTAAGAFGIGVYVITIHPDVISVKMAKAVKPSPRGLVVEAGQLPLSLEA